MVPSQRAVFWKIPFQSFLAPISMHNGACSPAVDQYAELCCGISFAEGSRRTYRCHFATICVVEINCEFLAVHLTTTSSNTSAVETLLYAPFEDCRGRRDVNFYRERQLRVNASGTSDRIHDNHKYVFGSATVKGAVLNRGWGRCARHKLRM